MSHKFHGREFSYSWGNELENSFSATVGTERSLPPKNSVEEFITEHYIGYSQGKNCSLEYKVDHPQWTCCQVDDYDISLSFAKNYGEDFAFLNDKAPYNVLYAAGSHVTASFPRRV